MAVRCHSVSELISIKGCREEQGAYTAVDCRTVDEGIVGGGVVDEGGPGPEESLVDIEMVELEVEVGVEEGGVVDGGVLLGGVLVVGVLVGGGGGGGVEVVGGGTGGPIGVTAFVVVVEVDVEVGDEEVESAGCSEGRGDEEAIVTTERKKGKPRGWV